METEKEYLEVNQVAELLNFSPEDIRSAIKYYDFLMELTIKIKKPVTCQNGKIINRWIRVISHPEEFIRRFKNKNSVSKNNRVNRTNSGWSITAQECFLSMFNCENCFYRRYFIYTKEKCHMMGHIIKTIELEGIPELIINRYKQKFEEVTLIHIDAQILEAERELKTRKKVYPHWIHLNKITQKLADQRIETQEAIVSTLKYFKSNYVKTDRNGQMHLF